jgi:23S rRNA pseudouridine1911/1915/1917 synthase
MKTDKPRILKIESYTVPLLRVKTRLQDLAPGMFVQISTKSGVKKALKNKLIKINGINATSGTFLLGGETIDLFQIQDTIATVKIDIDLEVIYEDEYLALVNKPPGITVSGNKKWTLENALSSHLKKSQEADALVRPAPIHRLDHPTSGILLIGKTASTVILLNKLFENREIQKTYYAVAIGKMTSKGSMTEAIDNKPSFTSYEVLQQEVSEKFEFLNLVKLTPESGRKHQLRKHLAEQGNPILGDSLYGDKGKILKGNGLYLHAYSLAFTHPTTKEKLLLSASPTKKFTRLFPTIDF